MVVLEHTEPIYCIENSPNEYHYFCSKECAEIGSTTSDSNHNYCERCGKELGRMYGNPLKTTCDWCGKQIIADSSCAGVELGNDEIYYFCSQNHATQWGNQKRNGN